MAGERLSPIEQLIRADRLKTIEQCAQIADSFQDKPLAGFDGEKQWKASEKIAAAIRSVARTSR